MQRTRLNLLLDETLTRFSRFFQNPWRKIALIIIFLLLGNLIATVFPTAIGQTPIWDPFVGAGLLVFTELVSYLYYYNRPKLTQSASLTKSTPRTQLLLDMIHAFKIGLIYGLFVGALAIGS